MNLIESIQFAYTAFIASRHASQQKDASAVVASWESGIPQYSQINYNNMARNGYRKNELIFACVNYRAETTAAATLKLYEVAGKEVEKHPARALIKRPNPRMTEFDFWMATSAMCDLGGSAYWLKERSRNGRVINLYPLRPDYVHPIPSSTTLIGGYQYLWGGMQQTFAADDVIAFTNFDPLQIYTGWSPAQVAARAADVDNATTDYVKLFFQNSASPRGLLKTKVKLNDAAVDDLKRRWREKYGGFENWSEVAVLDSDADYTQMGSSFKDMEFAALDGRNEARICMVFRMPPILINANVGLLHATYSNYKEARAAYIQDTAAPIWKHFADEYQLAMADEFGDAPDCRFDLANVPAYQDLMTAKWMTASDAWQKGLATRNEAREFAGFDTVSDGDLFFEQVQGARYGNPIPPGGDILPVLPADEQYPAQPGKPSAVAPPAPDTTNTPADTLPPSPAKAERKSDKNHADPAYRKAHGRKRDMIARAYEMRFRDASQQQFAAELKAILKAVNSFKSDLNMSLVADKIVKELKDSKTGWVTTFTPLVKALISDTGDQLAADFGISFDIKNPLVDEFIKKYVPKFADKIIDTSRNALVIDMLRKAQDAGWGIPELADSIKGQYAQWDDYRATVIARTETIRSSNAGAQEAIKQAEFKQKQWLSTNDDRTRADHVEADGQIVGIDEQFDVGGEGLSYPGDPDGSPENTIQCRCTVLPVG